MARMWRLVGLVGVVLALVAPGAPAATARPAAPAIVGVPVEQDQYRYVARILISDPATPEISPYLCTGVAIDLEIVLTAAHCLHPPEGEVPPRGPALYNYDLEIGGHRVGFGQLRTGVAINYISQFTNAYSDLGLIHLDAPLPDDSFVADMADARPAVGEEIRQIGWGRNGSGNVTNELLTATTYLSDCPNSDTELLCQAPVIGRPGDSGGPLLTPAHTHVHAKVAGIFSGAEPTSGGNPSYSIAVDPVRNKNWILEGIDRLAVMGDSYASGVGMTSTRRTSCVRHENSPGSRFAASFSNSLLMLACSDATVDDVRTDQLGSYDGIDNERRVKLSNNVLLTVGGNDLRFEDVLWCFAVNLYCDALDDLETNLNSLSGSDGKLVSLYKEILATTPRKLYVTTYPKLLQAHDNGSCDAALISDEEASLGDYWNDELNDAIREAVDIVKSEYGHRINLVPVETYFAGHGACRTDEYLHRYELGAPGTSFHPTDRGYQQMFEALVDGIGQGTRNALVQRVVFGGVVHERTVIHQNWNLAQFRQEDLAAPPGKNSHITALASFWVDGYLHDWVVRTEDGQSFLYTRMNNGEWSSRSSLPGNEHGLVTHLTSFQQFNPGDDNGPAREEVLQAYWRGEGNSQVAYMRTIEAVAGELEGPDSFAELDNSSDFRETLKTDIENDTSGYDSFAGETVVAHTLSMNDGKLVQALTMEADGVRHSFIRNLPASKPPGSRSYQIDWGCTDPSCNWETGEALEGFKVETDAIFNFRGAIDGQSLFEVTSS